jgi:hypothetical protein
MWLYIILAVTLVFVLVLTVVSGGAWTIFAIPLALVVAAVFVARALRSGRGTTPVVSMPPEPTGVPRSGHGGAETANQRVGQD